MTERVIQPWRDGDQPAPCAHRSCCGYTFRAREIGQHLDEAHLGSREALDAHLREGARLLVLGVELDSEETYDEEEFVEYEEALAKWLSAEQSRQKSVRGDGTFHATGVLP